MGEKGVLRRVCVKGWRVRVCACVKVCVIVENKDLQYIHITVSFVYALPSKYTITFSLVIL